MPSYANSINGAIAGSTAGFLTTPMDVLKTRRMTFQTTSTSAIDLAKSILQTEGVKGFFKGATVRIMYLSVGGSAFFGIYEKAK